MVYLLVLNKFIEFKVIYVVVMGDFVIWCLIDVI